MKVWILSIMGNCDGDWDVCLGVYSSKRKAVARRNKEAKRMFDERLFHNSWNSWKDQLDCVKMEEKEVE